MNSNKKYMDQKVVLSILWIFALLNYLYCDIITLMDPVLQKQMMSGTAIPFQLNQGFLLGASILMEIPIALILLSRLLKYNINRWINIIAGMIMTVVQTSSLFVGSSHIYYNFFSIIEISCTIFIVIYTIRWKKTDEETLFSELIKK